MLRVAALLPAFFTSSLSVLGYPISALCLSRSHRILHGTVSVEHERFSAVWPVVVPGVLFRKVVELLEDCSSGLRTGRNVRSQLISFTGQGKTSCLSHCLEL